MNLFITILSIIVILIGVFGIIIPLIPGVPLILGGILIYALYYHFTIISLKMIGFLFILAVISLISNHLLGIITIQKMGASKYGIYGGLIGIVIGLIFSPFGLLSIIIAPFLGTLVGELISGKKLIDSSKISIGNLIGYILAILLDFTIAGIMIYVFIRVII
jgi:hypothetical protein